MKLPERPLALLSVYNKDGIVEFAQALFDLGWDLLSSGGTAAKLREAGLEVTDVTDWVGGGAILGHKVVTLSREIHAGLLADLNSPDDMAELESLGLKPIHLVCCDLYPLQEAIAAPDATTESVLKLTDIGGTTMIHSAAKGGRIVICRPEDRQPVLKFLRHGTIDDQDTLISHLRTTAERVVAEYCLASAMYHGGGSVFGVIGTKVRQFTKGENGPQSPAFHYTTGTDDPLALDKFEQISGPPPSYVTITDIDRALQTATHIAATADGPIPEIVVGVKHGNPCAVSSGSWQETEQVFKRALLGSPRAIFGGLIFANTPINEALADILLHTALPEGSKKRILAGVVAPEFTPEAINLLSKKGGKRCGLWTNPALSTRDMYTNNLDLQPRLRYVRGGVLVQPNYTWVLDLASEQVSMYGVPAYSNRLSLGHEGDLKLAWAIGSTSNSNSITLVRGGVLIGNGVGQQDRVGAAELAVKLARDSGHQIHGAVAYSDSFFPFPDGPKVLADAGVVAILASSGSVNDGKVIEFCKQRGVTLYMIPDEFARGFYNH